MLLIVGTIRVPPEKLAEARPAMERMILASRVETGCLGYAYAEDVLEPGLIRVSEAWQDEACFAAHAASDHLKRWRADGAALGVFDRHLWRYDGGSARPL
jgi:quinol monooxygenase YgiN